MRYLLFLLTLTASAEVICVPYSKTLLAQLQAQPTPQSGVRFGVPLIEKTDTGARMCFSHPFAPTDDAKSGKVSDLKFVLSRVEAVAVAEGISASKDTAAERKLKVAALVKITSELPADFERPVAAIDGKVDKQTPAKLP